MKKRLKLLMLRGLPASGKSTFARELLEKYPGQWVRTNKDDIRSQLFFSKWSKHKEKLVLEAEDRMIVAALKAGYNVVVDNTHLVDKHKDRFRALLNANDLHDVTISIKEFTTSPEECIKRDLKRARSVGSDVIWSMYWNQMAELQYTEIEPTKKDAVLIDLDGTLAKMKGRGPFDWLKVGRDEVHEHIKILVSLYYKNNYEVIILSGRDSVCREETEDWLIDKDIPYNRLYMRPEGDTRKDYIVKGELYETFIKPYYNIFLVVDDRPQVLREWVKRGLPVVSANPLNREF